MDNKNFVNIELEYYSVLKKKEIFFSGKSTDLKYKLLSKVKQSQKEIVRILAHSQYYMYMYKQMYNWLQYSVKKEKKRKYNGVKKD